MFFADQVNMRFISQFISGILSVLQQSFKYLNGAVTTKVFALLSSGILPVIHLGFE